MWRYAVGMAAGLLLAIGGVLLLRPSALAQPAGRNSAIQPGRPAAAQSAEDEGVPEPPAASEKTREQKRFARYDKDKDGKVTRDEYLAARRKAFAKLDTNGDGRLSFEEWAIKAETKFAEADKDKSGILTPEEFATTRVVRKAAARCACPATTEKEEEQ